MSKSLSVNLNRREPVWKNGFGFFDWVSSIGPAGFEIYPGGIGCRRE